MIILRRLLIGRDEPLPLFEHLEELRRCIIFGLIGLFVTFFIGLSQQDLLLHWLLRPAGLTNLVALTVLEPLLVKFTSSRCL